MTLRLTVVCLFSLVFAANSPPSPAAQPDDSSVAVEDDGIAQGATVEFLELVYQGQTIRVPIKDGQIGQINIGDSVWQLSMSPLASETHAATSGGGAQGGLPDSPPERSISLSTVLLVAIMAALLLGVLGYFFVFEPMRRRKPLRQALQIIQKNQRPQFPHAEELLDQSLLAGLRKKDIAQARFALALLRAIVGKPEEAATVLSDLEKSEAEIDRPAAYLMLWVHARLKKHERVERIYSEYGGVLKGFRQSSLIASISYLALASLRMTRREINGALHYYDQVRKLEVLADEIPGHLDDHEVVTGIVSLFEKNKDEAEKHFQAAVKTAAQREKPTCMGRLGLLLCKWQEQNSSEVDEELGRILMDMQPAPAATVKSLIPALCPHCGKAYRVNATYEGKKIQCKGCRRRFPVEEHEEAEPEQNGEQQEENLVEDRLLSEDDLLLRNARLWHCFTRLFTWLDFEENSGLPEPERELLLKRLHDVSELDPDMGDPYLIEGLIRYYFAESEEDRKLGHQLIGKAVDREVHVPEVLQLLDRVNKLANLSEQSLTYFHQLSTQYAGNAEVDPELRQRFVRNMNRFSRFRSLGEVEPLPAEESVAPSLENLQGRGQILQTRVSNIVRYRLTDEDSSLKEEIGERLGELHERSQALVEDTRAFQQAELGLMESTGEFLFSDDEEEVELQKTPTGQEKTVGNDAELPAGGAQTAAIPADVKQTEDTETNKDKAPSRESDQQVRELSGAEYGSEVEKAAPAERDEDDYNTESKNQHAQRTAGRSKRKTTRRKRR